MRPKRLARISATNGAKPAPNSHAKSAVSAEAGVAVGNREARCDRARGLTEREPQQHEAEQHEDRLADIAAVEQLRREAAECRDRAGGNLPSIVRRPTRSARIPDATIDARRPRRPAFR
jgi:hypothetical protein